MSQSLIPQAITWKFPGAKCSKNVAGDGIDRWEPPADQPNLKKPNTIELVKILQEFEDFQRKNSYIALRREAFDPDPEQIGRITKSLKYLADKGVDIGPDGLAQVAHVDAVKAKYPKPQ